LLLRDPSVNSGQLPGSRSLDVTYKPHLDGIRAIAVLSVLLYHAHVAGPSDRLVDNRRQTTSRHAEISRKSLETPPY
jgi:hypothetical protein